MKILTLDRTCQNAYGTYGTYIYDYSPVCQCFELPWRNNDPQVSCIPPDLYLVSPHVSPNHGECYHIENVPGRTNVLIHAGNIDDNTLGCQLPGLYNGWVWSKKDKRNEWGVCGSRTAMERLEKILGRENDFWLCIKGVTDRGF